MSTFVRPGSMRVLSKLVLAVLCILCVLCLQPLCGCSGKPGDEGVVEQAVKYANARAVLDLADSSVVGDMPDAMVEISLLSFEDAPGGAKAIELMPAVVSDTMASWTQDEWAENRDDLFFNLVAHFTVICKQANEYGDVPEGYEVTCPDYMVVYDSQKNAGFVVTSTGVYLKTDDPENPIGEVVVITAQE